MRRVQAIGGIVLGGMLLAAPGCSQPTPSPADDFATANATFLAPPEGQLNLRYLKHREGAPAGQDRERLEAEFFPEAEGWRSMGHEIVSSADVVIRIDVGDRVDLRDEDEWPLADDTSTAPAWLMHVDVRATAGAPVVVMSGHRGLRSDVLRVVIIGDVHTVSAEGADMSPHVSDPTLPPAFVLERAVPAAHLPGRDGSFDGVSTGRFGSNAKFLHMPVPMEGSIHLTSWVHLRAEGGSYTSVQNDLHTRSSGNRGVKSDGMNVAFHVADEDVEWTAFPHTVWTLRMRANATQR